MIKNDNIMLKDGKNMKTNLTLEKWKKIDEKLNEVSPLLYDCGKLCGEICCNYTGEEEMGIYLFPGEHLLYKEDGDWLKWSCEKAQDYDFPPSWQGKIYFVKCKNPKDCHRNIRPFQCRTFPLKPYINEDGILELVYNYDELPYVCPIIENSMQITEEFYNVTYEIWKELMQEPLIYDLIVWESECVQI